MFHCGIELVNSTDISNSEAMFCKSEWRLSKRLIFSEWFYQSSFTTRRKQHFQSQPGGFPSTDGKVATLLKYNF